jgi:hypothetical protein
MTNLSEILVRQSQSHTETATAKRLVLAARSEELDIEKLHYLVVDIAQSEAVARLFATAADIVAVDPESLPQWIQEQSLRGADDSWSGRNNDLRRSVYDSKLDALRAIAMHYQLNRDFGS